MADSLFDGRYRYDYIYPRGRSGETLRAVDTQDNDRPVVVKRPAPNDAPPIRAGQEVSILNERKALTRLAGHAALTALVGNGQFLVGGTAHQYIAMERAEGSVLADTVLELEARGERLPELEMLVIIDRLLDLIQTAHAHDIVYNDVDAKHLFWDRDHYRLKVIDWGNAVFLEGDESTPQGVSRQSDVYQVGELLYFILSGGGRVDVPRDSGNQTEDFRLNFGEDAERVAPRLQAIVSKAAHPNLRFRYRTIADLRKDLADYRAPIERERNGIIARVSERLRKDRSKDELQGLLQTLQPAQTMDPGSPDARRVEQEIHDRLADLAVGADLDAARIYMESGNWPRAAALLDELRHRVRGKSAALIRLLLDWAKLLLDSDLQPAPPAVIDAIMLVFEGHEARAAHLLLTDQAAPAVEWLLAERITAYMPEVVLLRPNLYRLDTALAHLADEGMTVREPRALLVEINQTLDQRCGANAASLVQLRDGYRQAQEQLATLATLLEKLNADHSLPDRRLPLSALERARQAAAVLSDQVKIMGERATVSPRDAMAALDISRAVDPLSPAWDMVAALLDGLYERLGAYQTYVPAADGSDIETWLQTAQTELLPFAERLFDDMLSGMVRGLGLASRAWVAYAGSAVQGNRVGAVAALSQAVDAVNSISPPLAGWLTQLRTIVSNAQYVERHALYGVLGRALADGWEAFDRGRLTEAEQLGQRGLEIARTDPERFAATRLRTLVETARGWLERNGISDAKRTQATLESLEGLYTADEQATRENFAAQMPSKEIYLKAMSKGLVELYARNSTAAVRLLFFNYILLGALDAQEGALDDAGFWGEAAVKTLGDYGPRHVATRALDEFIERRRDLNAGAALLNTVNGPHLLPTLDSTRKGLEENPQARTLSAGIYSLRELEASLRDWSDGEFRAAGSKLENALRALGEVEQAGAITLTGYRAWLVDLLAAAAELHTQSRKIAQTIEQRPDQPVDAVRQAHQHQVEVTQRMLGDAYAATLRQWRDTYQNFLSVYTDSSQRRSAKLGRFNELFRAMFIDRHPAYPLYRHWYDLTENAPEFPAPPTSEPTPRMAEGTEVAPEEYKGSRYADPPPEADSGPRRPISRRRLALIGGGLILLLAVVYVVIRLRAVCCAPQFDTTPTAAVFLTQTAFNQTEMAVALLATDAARTGLPLETIASPTAPPVFTPTLPDLSVSPLPFGSTVPPATLAPTDTFTPAPTATPTATDTATVTPMPTATPLPPQGLQGDQDLLALASRLTALPWNSDQFSLVQAVEGPYWRLGLGEDSATSSADNTGSDMMTIGLPADLLETYYGNHAATRIRRMRATLTLTTSNPALIPQNEVYFGASLQSASDPTQTVGLNVQVPQLGVINLGQRTGDQVQVVSQRSVSAIVARIRLERDLNTGKVTIYFNDEPMGDPLSFVGPQDGVLPVLFVRAGGVIVSVTDWTISLR